VKQVVLVALLALSSSMAYAVDAEPAAESESFDVWAWIVSLFESTDADDAQTSARYLVKSDGVIYD
jgi:hypothetical protein